MLRLLGKLAQDFLLGRWLVMINKKTNKTRTRGFVGLCLNRIKQTINSIGIACSLRDRSAFARESVPLSSLRGRVIAWIDGARDGAYSSGGL